MPLYVFSDPLWQGAMYGLPLVLFAALAMAPDSRTRASRAAKLFGPMVFIAAVWVCCLVFSSMVIPGTLPIVVNLGLVLLSNGSMIVITWFVFNLIARYE